MTEDIPKITTTTKSPKLTTNKNTHKSSNVSELVQWAKNRNKHLSNKKLRIYPEQLLDRKWKK